MNKIIRVAEHAGFCPGVSAAVRTCEEQLERAEKAGETLYCLGELIHNRSVTAQLASKGLVTVSDISEVPEGGKVLIRAHGEPDRTYEEAAARNISVTDATCPFVSRIHRLAKEAREKGRWLIVAGDAAHPEVIGILGSTDMALGAAGDARGAEELARTAAGRPVTVVSQTTMTKERFEEVSAAVKAVIPDAETIDTICRATAERQEGAARLARGSDAMIVLGDAKSSNSKKLFEICEKNCGFAVFADNFDNLPLHRLCKYNRIGIAAGASTPERIIKEVISGMSEVFTADQNNEMMAYMDEIEKSLKLPQRGEVVTGEVVVVTNDYVVVNLGCKKDGMLPKEEITLEEGQTLTALFKEGDEIQAKVIKTDDGDGNILLSKKKLQSGENWDEINAALDSKEVVNVTVVRAVKGGVIAAYKEVSGFIPMSQLADHYVDEEKVDEFIGKTLPVKVTRVDQRRNKAVFSHKAFLNEEREKKLAEIWQTLSVGDVVEGKVMRFTDYGAFVDIGGIDGLLHISEISWGKLRHPQEVLEIGQTVNVKILSMNAEKGKISLGLKQNAPEPWSVIDESYHVGDVIRGKVVQIKEYGAFVELAPGLDGLVHISELAYKRVNKVSDELEIGQEVEAKILEIDKERKRISLSIKETLDAPAPAAAEEAPAAPAAEAAEAAEAPAAEEAPAEE